MPPTGDRRYGCPTLGADPMSVNAASRSSRNRPARRFDIVATSRQSPGPDCPRLEWSERPDSPLAPELVDEGGSGTQLACLRGRPGHQERFVQRLTLLVRQIIALVIDDQVKLGPVGQRSRLIEV